MDSGIYGVAIFFAISGFLITYLLRLEKDKNQKIAIKKFYVRRALRLFPLYYTQIIVCLIIYYIFDIEYTLWSLIIYGFYAANIPYIFSGTLPLLGHYWTLAVEEQFYFFWPWLNRFTNKQLLKVCWILLISFVIIRQLLIYSLPDSIVIKMMDHAWFQCMLIGGIFALYYLDYRPVLLKISEFYWLQIICWSLLMISPLNLFREYYTLDMELYTIAGCLILVNQNSNRVFFNLENSFFNYTGRLTYGIYIVHNPIIFLCGKLIPWSFIAFLPLRYILVFMVVFSLSTITAHLSYKYLETPFLRLKERKFTIVKSMKI